MPVGVGIGTAVIGAGGAILGGQAQKSAAKTAAKAAEQGAAVNDKLIRDIYGENASRLDPYHSYGLEAGGALMDLLLGGNHAAASSSRTLQPASDAEIDNWAQGALSALAGEVNPGIMAKVRGIADPSDRLSALEPLLQKVDRQVYSAYLNSNARPTGKYVTTTAPAAGSTNAGALDAFAKFRQGTNYNWRLNEGLNARNLQMAARGGLESGAAEKSAIEFGQNLASDELSRYMNLLSDQYRLGLGAASSLAGNGQGMAGALVSNNNAATSAAGNAAIASGNANASMWTGIAGSLGQGIGSVFQSSFAPNPQYGWYPTSGAVGM
jgi:hypothetical protein